MTWTLLALHHCRQWATLTKCYSVLVSIAPVIPPTFVAPNPPVAPTYNPPPFQGPISPLPPYVGPVTPTTCAPDTLVLWHFLPQFLKDADAANDYLFLTWLDGMGQQLQILDNLCRDDAGGQPGWSILLDVGRCPTYALPWLAQFVGVRFNGAQLASDSAMRTAILAEGNFKRGTVAAIQAAAAPYLAPGGYVNIIERYPDAYSLTVQVFGDLNAATYAELTLEYPTYNLLVPGNPPYPALPYYSSFPHSNQSTVTAAIEAAIPAGLVTTVVYFA